MLNTILSYAAVIILAATAGAGHAVLMQRNQGDVSAHKTDPHAATVPDVAGVHDLVFVKLPPVVTNLRTPDSMWVRIDAAIAFEKQFEKDLKTMNEKLGQDIASYLRTLTLKELEGPSALTNLRHDLIERINIRTENRVKDVFITTMVVQ